MLLKMKQDIGVSYKYNILQRGNIYDTDKEPKEVATKLMKCFKENRCIEINKKDSVVVTRAGINEDVLRLEESQKQQEENAERIVEKTVVRGRKRLNPVETQTDVS